MISNILAETHMQIYLKTSPLVLGKIQVDAQWMWRGQPLKTLEKQAPICSGSTCEYHQKIHKRPDSDWIVPVDHLVAGHS